jgi:hypothetical protein
MIKRVAILLLIAYTCLALRVAIVPWNSTANDLHLQLMRRSRLLSSDLITSAFLTFQIYVTVLGKTFITHVDSGSWATSFPYGTVNGSSYSEYGGLSIDDSLYSIPPESTTCSEIYGSGSWSGNKVTATMDVQGTSISSSSTLGLITTHTDFLYVNQYEGILGIAMNGATHQRNRIPSPMDDWYANNLITNNQVAFHGCPYPLSEFAWIDIGNETPYTTSCSGGVSASIISPPSNNGFFTVDVKEFWIGGVSYALPSTFQQSRYSFVDSGSGWLHITSTPLSALRSLLKTGGGLTGTTTALNAYTSSTDIIPSSAIVWTKLPNITLTMKSYGINLYTRLTIGPKQYLTQVDSTSYFFAVSSVGNSYMNIGYPYFTNFHVTLDRGAVPGVTWKPGCNCGSSDGLPRISTYSTTTTTTTSTVLAPTTTSVVTMATTTTTTTSK